MKRIEAIIISISFIAFSCNNETKNDGELPGIDVNVSSESSKVSLSDVAEYSLLLLPTNDSLVIGEINRVHNSSDYIYLSDVSAVYKFTHDGRLENKLNRQGDGPEEYLNISDFAIDDDDNIWILSRSMQTLFQYTWDRRLKKRIKVNLWPLDICMIDNKNILLYTGNELNESNKQLHLLNVDTGEIALSYKPIDENQSKYLHVKGTNSFQKLSADTVRFIQLFNDTVYRVTSETFYPELLANWDGHNVPESYYKKEFQTIMDFFQDFHSKGIYAYGINFFVETKTSYWISFYYQKKCFCSIVSKTGGKYALFDKICVNEMHNYPVDLIDTPVFVQDNGSIAIPINAINVKEFLEGNNLSSSDIPEDSNPYLLIITPKI